MNVAEHRRKQKKYRGGLFRKAGFGTEPSTPVKEQTKRYSDPEHLLDGHDVENQPMPSKSEMHSPESNERRSSHQNVPVHKAGVQTSSPESVKVPRGGAYGPKVHKAGHHLPGQASIGAPEATAPKAAGDSLHHYPGEGGKPAGRTSKSDTMLGPKRGKPFARDPNFGRPSETRDHIGSTSPGHEVEGQHAQASPEGYGPDHAGAKSKALHSYAGEGHTEEGVAGPMREMVHGSMVAGGKKKKRSRRAMAFAGANFGSQAVLTS